MTDGELCGRFDRLRKSAAGLNLILRADEHAEVIVLDDVAYPSLQEAELFFKGYEAATLALQPTVANDPLTQLDKTEETGWKDI